MSEQFRYYRIDLPGDVTKVTPTVFDFVDQTHNVEMKCDLTKYAVENKPGKILVDFKNIQRFSTEFIGTLLSIKKLLGPNVVIKLCCMEEVQREIFGFMNLDGTVFDIYDTEAEAMESF